MADPPRYTETGDDAGVKPDQGAPRWLPVVGIIVAIALVLLFVVFHLTGSVVGPGAH